ncbi:MAG: DUF2726 domain-containing protein [FCB group bacterium]|jgi:hypothetical protein|nr:DUF2726 domain-containing protein [FCB group bacterium]
MLYVVAKMILVAIGFGILAAAVKAISAWTENEAQDLPYERADLFSLAERSFLGVLEQALAGQYRVMGKVRLGDVIGVRPGRERGERQGAKNRIMSKHVDFVVCDPATLSVQFVVELDDKSHNRPERQERDGFVDGALEAAGIRIVRFSTKRGYSIQAIRDEIFGAERAPGTPSSPGALEG